MLSLDMHYFQLQTSQKVLIPLAFNSVSAGFPSPAQDFLENHLDLNEYLIEHPTATFFVRVQGDSMQGDRIFDGDLLIVDRALEPKDGDVIIALLDGEFTVKRINKNTTGFWLVPSNKHYRKIKITSEMDFSIWGVVLHTIRSFR